MIKLLHKKSLNNRITYLEGKVSILEVENVELKNQLSGLNMKLNGQNKNIANIWFKSKKWWAKKDN